MRSLMYRVNTIVFSTIVSILIIDLHTMYYVLSLDFHCCIYNDEFGFSSFALNYSLSNIFRWMFCSTCVLDCKILIPPVLLLLFCADRENNTFLASLFSSVSIRPEVIAVLSGCDCFMTGAKVVSLNPALIAWSCGFLLAAAFARCVPILRSPWLMYQGIYFVAASVCRLVYICLRSFPHLFRGRHLCFLSLFFS